MTPTEIRSIPETPWARPWKEIADALRVSVADGLADREAKSRRKQYGPNRLRRAKPASAWTILAGQFKSLLVGLCTALLLAAVYVPGLNTLLRVEDPGLDGWGLVLGASLLPWLAGQVFRSWKTRLNGRSNNGRAGDKPRILIEGE